MPSWDRIYLLETVDEYVISELRLSEPDMIFAVLGVLLIFALVFPFLFAAIAIYGNQGSATVIVQTVIIGSTGLFANIKGTISDDFGSKRARATSTWTMCWNWRLSRSEQATPSIDVSHCTLPVIAITPTRFGKKSIYIIAFRVGLDGRAIVPVPVPGGEGVGLFKPAEPAWW